MCGGVGGSCEGRVGDSCVWEAVVSGRVGDSCVWEAIVSGRVGGSCVWEGRIEAVVCRGGGVGFRINSIF